MDDGSRLSWIIVLFLLFCAVMCAVMEISIASVSKVRIKTMADRGDNRAKKVLYALDNFDKAISTLLICTNIVHISTASIVTMAVTRRWGVSAVSISTIITTIVIFFAGEMLPKSVAKKYSERCSLATGGLLVFFMRLFSPLSKLLAMFGDAVSKLTHDEAQISVTEDELYDIIEDMTEEGTLNEEQGELISSALQFGNVTVESILTPRVDLAAIDIRMTSAQIMEFIKPQTHSRLPVYEGSIDNIIGVLQIRTFIKAYLREGDALDIRKLLDEVFFIHQSANIDELLPIMSKRKLNMAVVTDNYGGTLGVVTVEDILEELVGEIWDEDDVVEENIVKLDDVSYKVDSEVTVDTVFEEIGFEDPEEDGELINKLMGEWAYEQFTAIPRPGDSFGYNGLGVTVSEMEHNRILSFTVTLPANEEGGDVQ